MNTAALPIVGPASSVPVPHNDVSALLLMVERAARDPNVDIIKLEKLMDMSNAVREREAERAFNEAMAAVQGKMRAVAADANNPQTRSKYASYFALDKALRPIYSGEGIALSFNTEDGAPADHVRVVCYVTRGSFTRKYHVDMPADGKGAKGGDVMTKTHAAGSAFTYGQRYLLKMIFNVAIGEDDDGNGATHVERVSERQAEQLRELLEESGKDKAKFLKWARVDRIEDVPAAHFQSCVDAITRPVQK